MHNKIKVLYILHDTDRNSGASKSFLSMLSLLISDDIEPVVVIPNNKGLSVYLDSNKIKYFVVNYRNSVYPNFNNFKSLCLFFPKLIFILSLNWKAKFKIAKIAKQENIKIIHTNVGPIHLGYHVAKRISVKHVWHIREYQDLHFGWTPIFSKKMFIQKLNNKINNNIVITSNIRKHYSIRKNYKVINDGVQKEGQTIFEPNKSKYFLFAGRLTLDKGIEELLLAFIDFHKNNKTFKLYIAGDTNDGIYFQKLKKIVSNAGVNESINFMGMRNDIFTLMSKATALIVPSKYEGFGMITAEAMFNGCLVIGRNTGGTKEILEKQQLGILYSDHQTLVNAMNDVTENGISSYFHIIKKAQNIANNLYSIEQNEQKVLQYYKEILRTN